MDQNTLADICRGVRFYYLIIHFQIPLRSLPAPFPSPYDPFLHAWEEGTSSFHVLHAWEEVASPVPSAQALELELADEPTAAALGVELVFILMPRCSSS